MKPQHVVTLGIALSLGAFSQTNAQTSVASAGGGPTFGVTVTTRTVEAINYRHHGSATKLDFRGTDLMPAANGVARVKSNRGSIAIQAEFGELLKPTSFGTEYLTYVLWAISPEGSAVNLGEVLVGGDYRSKINVTTGLQAFALIVTAEPYFAVHQPSNVVVLENVVRTDTSGLSQSKRYYGGRHPSGHACQRCCAERGAKDRIDQYRPIPFFASRICVSCAVDPDAG